MTLNNTIIRNLGGVAKAIDEFEKGIALFNASAINTLQVMKNNMYFANWMGLLMLAAYTFVGGLEVVGGKMRPNAPRVTYWMTKMLYKALFSLEN